MWRPIVATDCGDRFQCWHTQAATLFRSTRGLLLTWVIIADVAVVDHAAVLPVVQVARLLQANPVQAAQRPCCSEPRL
jgi:hypothetical protein